MVSIQTGYLWRSDLVLDHVSHNPTAAPDLKKVLSDAIYLHKHPKLISTGKNCTSRRDTSPASLMLALGNDSRVELGNLESIYFDALKMCQAKGKGKLVESGMDVGDVGVSEHIAKKRHRSGPIASARSWRKDFSRQVIWLGSNGILGSIIGSFCIWPSSILWLEIGDTSNIYNFASASL